MIVHIQSVRDEISEGCSRIDITDYHIDHYKNLILTYNLNSESLGDWDMIEITKILINQKKVLEVPHYYRDTSISK